MSYTAKGVHFLFCQSDDSRGEKRLRAASRVAIFDPTFLSVAPSSRLQKGGFPLLGALKGLESPALMTHYDASS